MALRRVQSLRPALTPAVRGASELAGPGDRTEERGLLPESAGPYQARPRCASPRTGPSTLVGATECPIQRGRGHAGVCHGRTESGGSERVNCTECW